MLESLPMRMVCRNILEYVMNTTSTSETDAPPPPSSWGLMRRLLGLAWEYRLGCVKALTLQIILLALGLMGLGLMGLGVDYLRFQMSGGDTIVTQPPAASSVAVAPHAVPKPPRWPFGLEPPGDWPPLTVVFAIGVAILLFAALRAVLNISYTVAEAQLVQGKIVVNLRTRLYDKMQRLSFRFFDAHSCGTLINRVTSDVQAVRGFVDGVVIQSFILLLSLVVYFVYMVRIHAGLTFACLSTTPMLWILTARFSRRMRPAYLANRELFDNAVRVLTENVLGVHVVKGFAKQREEREKFGAASGAVRDQKQWISRQISNYQPLIVLMTYINLVILMGYGGYLVICHERAADIETAVRVGLSVGELLVFAGLLQHFSGQVATVANIANTIQQSLTGAQRVFEMLDAPVDIVSPPRAKRLYHVHGDVRFENVSVAYKQEEAVLQDISFHLTPGCQLAILGETGSGKSTLLSLIPRFYDPRVGRVRVDGHDVREVDLDDLRRSIGVVFQESFLFSNTIAANIAFGHPEATMGQIERAARIAAAHDFIMAMPDGYRSVLREGGTNLSGGQRQRLAIARAILLDPAILLLDDPTAAVDANTEHEIMDAIDNAMSGRTSLIVTHRLSVLRRADDVLVLNKGRLVQRGAHDMLMNTTGPYRRAARMQLGDAQSLALLGLGAEGRPT